MSRSKMVGILSVMHRVVNRLAPVMVICGFIVNEPLLVMVGIGLILYNEIMEYASYEQWKKKKVSYKSFWGEANSHNRNKYKDDKCSYDDIVFDNRGEAETVLDQMFNIIADYGCCSVADLYALSGVTGDYTDNKVGWTDIKKASVARARTGYVLKLPKPVTLK